MRFKVVDYDQALLADNKDEYIWFEEEDFSDEKYKSYLLDTKTNMIVYRDGGEPEDQTLGRDQRVLVELLNYISCD